VAPFHLERYFMNKRLPRAELPSSGAIQERPQARQIALAPARSRLHLDGKDPAVHLDDEVHFVPALLVPEAESGIRDMRLQQGGEVSPR
jgi:hypothetical protein